MSNKAGTDDFIRRVERFARRHAMFRSNETYLVALSGGADSVALLVVLQRMGITIRAAHCNFRLRGEESERDEHFVRALCARRNIPLHVARYDTREFAALRRMSIEMAARHLRYAYFRQLCADIGAAAVCVAHHRDDSAETVLLNILRGTGLRGLQGIRPIRQLSRDEKGDNVSPESETCTSRSPLRVLRPLLCVDRHDIETFLSDVGQDYVIDSTNLETDATRNKIRLDVIPALRRINPNAIGAILRTARHAAEAERIVDAAMEKMRDEVATTTAQGMSVSVAKLLEQPSPEYALYHLLTPFGFSSEMIENINENVNAESGRLWQSATHTALLNRGSIIVEPTHDSVDGKEYRLPMEGVYVLDGDTRIAVETLPFELCGGDVKASVAALSERKDEPYLPGQTLIALDADKASLPFTIRRARPGDRFQPFGMKGTQLVSDYLTDRKRSLFEKQRQLVLTDTNGNILWLVGERAADWYRVTKETTRVIVVSVKY